MRFTTTTTTTLLAGLASVALAAPVPQLVPGDLAVNSTAFHRGPHRPGFDYICRHLEERPGQHTPAKLCRFLLAGNVDGPAAGEAAVVPVLGKGQPKNEVDVTTSPPAPLVNGEKDSAVLEDPEAPSFRPLKGEPPVVPSSETEDLPPHPHPPTRVGPVGPPNREDAVASVSSRSVPEIESTHGPLFTRPDSHADEESAYSPKDSAFFDDQDPVDYLFERQGGPEPICDFDTGLCNIHHKPPGGI